MESETNFDSTTLRNRLHDGGDVEIFDNLILNGQFDVDEADVEIMDYVKRVQENMMKIVSIHEAIKEGDARKVKNLIDRKKLIAARGRDGQNALALAIICGRRDIVEYLVEAYPNCINLHDKDGRTALHYAASSSDQAIYQLLIEKGGDESLADAIGHTAAFYKEHPCEGQS